MKEIADWIDMAPSILSSLYTTVLPNYFEGITDDMRRDAKRRVMETTPEDIGRFASLIGAVAEDGRCAVVGCKEKIDAASDVFTVKEDI